MKKSLCILIAACLAAVFLTSCSGNSSPSGNDPSSSNESILESNLVSSTDNTAENASSSFLTPLTEPQIQLRKLNSEHSVLDNSVSLKNTTESGRILFVKETDTMFWTDNKYLYQKTGGECFTIAEGIIYSLNLLNGRLYFICSDTIAAVQPMRGLPYMLDLATGELTMLSDKTTSAIYIQQDRLFLKHWESYIDENGKTMGRYFYCQCEPDGSSPELRSDIVLCTNGDWYVTCEQEESSYNIYCRNDKENIKKLIAIEEYLPKMVSIHGEYLYYVEGSWGDVFKRTSLDGGDTDACDTKRNYILDYAFADDKPALLTDMGFGAVDDDMVFNCTYISFDDNKVKDFYSVYNYNNEVIATVRGGYQLLTKRDNGNCLSSSYSFS